MARGPSVTEPIHSDGLPQPQRSWAVLAIALGIGMAVLDGTVANIALPAITRSLGIGPASAVWVVNAYQLAIVISLLPLAALGEKLGYRRVYVWGVAIFTLGSLACALSHSLPVLIAARIVQGFGAAGIMSVNGALVRYTYPHALLGRGVGLNALVVSASAALGPTIAAGILALGPWEWLFAVNVPFGIANLVIASRALPRSDLRPAPLDWTSVGLNAAAFGLFFIGVDGFARGASGAALGAAAVAAAVLAGLALARREMRVETPLIPLDLLRIPIFSLSVGASICAFAAYAVAFLALPFYFRSVLHLDQTWTGLLMTPWPVGLGLAAPFAGRLSDRIASGALGGVGMALLAVGLVWLAWLPADAGALDIVWRTGLCGIGFGLFQAPNNRTLLSAAPRQRAGAAGGMLAVARLVGMTSGAAISAILFQLAGGRAETLLLLIGAVLALVAAGASLARLQR